MTNSYEDFTHCEFDTQEESSVNNQDSGQVVQQLFSKLAHQVTPTNVKKGKWTSPFITQYNKRKQKSTSLKRHCNQNMENIKEMIPEYENNETAPSFCNQTWTLAREFTKPPHIVTVDYDPSIQQNQSIQSH
jgi:hypothetical protein